MQRKWLIANTYVICGLIDHIYRIILITNCNWNCAICIDFAFTLHRTASERWEYWTRKYRANAHASLAVPAAAVAVAQTSNYVFFYFSSFQLGAKWFNWLRIVRATLACNRNTNRTHWPSETQREASENSKLLADNENRSNQTEIM